MKKFRAFATKSFGTKFSGIPKANKIDLNLTFRMRFNRFRNEIKHKPAEIISIGEDFKQAINNENHNRALEILGKYNDKTLIKILDYKTPTNKIQLNLNPSAFFNSMNNKKEKSDEANKTKEKEKDNKSQTDYFSLVKKVRYEKLFTKAEMEIIDFISNEKDKVFDHIRKNPLDSDSILLRDTYALSVNLNGKRKEGKLLYIFLALLIFCVSYDFKKTIKCKKKYKFFLIFL
jgi:hypothetical protein